MADPITSLPTRGDGLLGRLKADFRPVPQLLNFIQAVEWNTLIGWVESAAAVIGVSAGSTAGSLFQLLLSFLPPKATGFAFFDDFRESSTNNRWLAVVTGTGTVTDVPALGVAQDGWGQVSCAVGAGAGTAELRGNVQSTSGAHSPRIRFRFKTPSTFTGISWRGGIRDAAGVTVAQIGWNSGSASVRYQVGSVTGGGSADAVASGVPTSFTVSRWYEGRVEVDSGTEVRFYLDDVLVHTYTTAAGIPRAGDTFSAYSSLVTYVSAALAVLTDWMDLRGTRL